MRSRGFTLIELLVVLGIIALMLTLAMPRFFAGIDKSKEAVLAENLRNVRIVLDQYYSDTGSYPESLEQLVEKKYLMAAPIDPLTESDSSWIIVPPAGAGKGRVYNIRSSAAGNDRSGKPYSDW